MTVGVSTSFYISLYSDIKLFRNSVVYGIGKMIVIKNPSLGTKMDGTMDRRKFKKLFMQNVRESKKINRLELWKLLTPHNLSQHERIQKRLKYVKDRINTNGMYGLTGPVEHELYNQELFEKEYQGNFQSGTEEYIIGLDTASGPDESRITTIKA